MPSRAGLVIVGKNPDALAGAASASGDLLILGCVACWVAYSVGSRGLSQALGPLQTVTWSILLGTAMLWLAAWGHGDASLASIAKLDAAQWGGLLYLGALGSALAYIWYYDGIRRIGATRAGVFIALNPLSAVLLGAACWASACRWRWRSAARWPSPASCSATNPPARLARPAALPFRLSPGPLPAPGRQRIIAVRLMRISTMDETSVRLSKRMVELGLCSRREADACIEQGLVKVDGKVVNTLGARVRPEQQITLAGKPQAMATLPVTMLLNRPAGEEAPPAQLLGRTAARRRTARNRSGWRATAST
ncbi:Ribosomal large subunit pseudouridine synthase F [Chromobacterium violaceum]|uniref:Dual-specificity RNA pseudouridine synthase RluF n=1 Tax=Chromobacterium violaceum TaxID=536 RepID=A0A3S4K1C6_CHRVL|nr:Ribosomal large subunit pseudouridine synthase F [Chromobacterium violaceum]